MMNGHARTLVVTLTLLLIASAARAQTGGGYDLTWSTLDGGGETFSTGGGYELGGTIGQPDAGETTLTGGGYALTGGFWAGAQPSTTSGIPTVNEWGLITLVLVLTVAGVMIIRRRQTATA